MDADGNWHDPDDNLLLTEDRWYEVHQEFVADRIRTDDHWRDEAFKTARQDGWNYGVTQGIIWTTLVLLPLSFMHRLVP